MTKLKIDDRSALGDRIDREMGPYPVQPPGRRPQRTVAGEPASARAATHEPGPHDLLRARIRMSLLPTPRAPRTTPRVDDPPGEAR